jgi:DNA (cytosine-5)-methyltransferase 1
MKLVLSLFPGIDLLGRGFEAEGFAVVRGPDLIWGQSIEDFHVPSGKFEGVIGGSPCQQFSLKNRNRDKAEGERLLEEFARLVKEAQPDWWLLENVPTVSDVAIDGYKVQRLDLRASECGLKQNRLRHFQFGSKDGRVLIPERENLSMENNRLVTLEACCLASEGKKTSRRGFADFCELQGLPRDFELPGWPIAFKYKAVGNGVPVPMAGVIARSIKSAVVSQGQGPALCECNCGRVVRGKQKAATPACRKRLQRKREQALVGIPGTVTVELG